MKRIDLIGKKFNRLLVLEKSENSTKKHKQRLWKCLCDCGKEIITNSNYLTTGHTKSCGCYQIERCQKSNTTHGLCPRMNRKEHIKFYNTYSSIKSRCGNPNRKDYPRYGGEGIKNLWTSFEEFRDDMYESYKLHIKEFGKRQTTIDRIDSGGHYSKENCRWADYHIQRMNQRRMIIT